MQDSATNLTVTKNYLTGIIILSVMLTAVLLIHPFIFKTFGLSLVLTFIISRILFWICLGLMILYSLKIEKDSFLLWHEKRGDLSFYILSVIAIFGILIAGLTLINLFLLKVLHIKEQSEKMKQLIPVFKANKWMIYVTCITAGVVEELLFRGYLLPRLQVLIKSPVLAIAISTLIFALMHATYGTIGQVVGPFFIGLIFAVYYYKFRNMKVIIFCHILWDLMVLGAMMMLKK